MGILDELRDKAEGVKMSSETEKERQERLYQKYLREINPKLKQFYNFLHELVSHLKVVNLELYAKYELPVVGEFNDFKQGQYKIVADSDTEMKDIMFTFCCEREQEFSFFLDSRVEVERVEEFFFKNHIKFYCKKEKDQRYNVISGDFRVKPVIPVLIRISADLEQSNIAMTITNFDGFGVRKLVLKPEQITEEFLDKFGRYIVRRESDFLTTKLSEDEKQKIRDRMLKEKLAQEEELKRLAEAEEAAAQLAREKSAKKSVLSNLFSIRK